MKRLTIEKCSIEHWEVLQKVAINTFRATYEHHNTPENFLPYLDKSFSEASLKTQLSNPNCLFYLAKFQGKVVGYIKLNEGEAQTETRPNSDLEIERIYLTKAVHGLGFGKQWIDFVVQLAKERGKTNVWLGVWSKNENAIGFYKKQGFVETGTHTFLLGDDEQLDYVMERGVG